MVQCIYKNRRAVVGGATATPIKRTKTRPGQAYALVYLFSGLSNVRAFLSVHYVTDELLGAALLYFSIKDRGSTPRGGIDERKVQREQDLGQRGVG